MQGLCSRYVEISGLPYAPQEGDVTRLVTHNDVTSSSSLLFNDDGAGVLNAINQGCRNSIVGNLLGGEHDRSHAQLTCARWTASYLPIAVCSGPGSCGGRDERQWFTGDTNFAGEASLLHYDLAPIYSNCRPHDYMTSPACIWVG